MLEYYESTWKSLQKWNKMHFLGENILKSIYIERHAKIFIETIPEEKYELHFYNKINLSFSFILSSIILIKLAYHIHSLEDMFFRIGLNYVLIFIFLSGNAG